MIASIKIAPQMNCEYICNVIQQAVLRYQKDNPDLTDCLMVIDIKKPSDDNNHIPKLPDNSSST
jgi:hypothetical protein